METPLLEQLIQAFCCLPGIGAKSAKRMAFYLLEQDRSGGKQLALILDQAINEIGQCQNCRILTEDKLCQLCANPKRDNAQLCIVQTPADVLAIESATQFEGHYFVLGGHISPLDGMGPEDIGLDILEKRMQEGQLNEIILATNPTIEGQATAHYIHEKAKKYQIKVSRIAFGVPLGGELEFVDGGTLSHAFTDRHYYP